MQRIVLLSFGCVLLFWGCTTAHYKKSADNETYAAIKQKGRKAPGMEPNFTIDQPTNISYLAGLPISTNVDVALGKDGEAEAGAGVISLKRALEIGVKNSRIYQSQKERLYLSALALTLARHEYTPIFSGGTSETYAVNTEQAVAAGIDPLTGNPTAILSDNVIERKQVQGNSALGVDWFLMTGGRLSAAFTSDFLRYLNLGPQTLANSSVVATLTQPLWRGAGYKVAIENLTEAERGLLYSLRNFSQFRRDFSVQIATAYYGVLQNLDSARNSYLGYQGFKRSAERTRALAQEGRAKQADVARLQQQELANQSAWISAIRSYKLSLDQFKIQLGLPTEANIILDDQELADLKIIHPDLSPDDAQKVALATRLDLATVHDQVEDSDRAVYLAANGLQPQVDLVANAGFVSPQNSPAYFPGPDPKRYHWSAGLNLDLPLDRKAQRNAYRSALIAREQARRQFEQETDQIKLQVRDNWRSLDQAKRNYEINEVAVRLSERRVEEETMLAELGRGTAEAQVSAQNDFITSKNALTAALVGHTIARLQFWDNLGILYIKDHGQWEEPKSGTH